MILSQRLYRPLISATVIATLGVACSSRLRDYTQLNLQADIPQTETEEAIAASLAETQSVLEKRLLSLGVEDAEVTTETPNTITVRLPQAVVAEILAPTLISTAQLTFRRQKADTEDKLALNIENLQRLLVEQNTLVQTDKPIEAEALQPEVDKLRANILALFEPAEITGDMLLDAQAVQNTGFNVWDVRLWFDSEGTGKFTAQTKEIAGTGRAIGIFLDDVLLSTPVVPVDYAEKGILGGEASITGNFTREAAKTIERQLKSGALPVNLELVSISSSDDPEVTEESEAEESETKESETKETAPKTNDSPETEEPPANSENTEDAD